MAEEELVEDFLLAYLNTCSSFMFGKILLALKEEIIRAGVLYYATKLLHPRVGMYECLRFCWVVGLVSKKSNK